MIGEALELRYKSSFTESLEEEEAEVIQELFDVKMTVYVSQRILCYIYSQILIYKMIYTKQVRTDRNVSHGLIFLRAQKHAMNQCLAKVHVGMCAH